MNKERVSNIELLRIVALWMIVVFHILAFTICQVFSDASYIYKAIWLPLHVGVVLFILISGYFRIKPSTKGIIKLLSYMFVYTVPVGLIKIYYDGGGMIDIVKTCLFVSNSPYWFMRTYLCLYVASPIINKLLDISGAKQNLTIILILSFIALYLGLAHFDESLNSGKNVVNFSLIYILGAMINKYKIWEKYSRWSYLWIFLSMNLLEIFIYSVFAGNLIGEGFFYICFHYCSPILIFNAIMLFCFTLNFKFKSRIVNWAARSALAIYLFHPIIVHSIIEPVTHYLYDYNSSFLFVFPLILIIGAVTAIVCIMVDKLLSPIYYISGLLIPFFNRMIARIETKLDLLSERIERIA